MTFHITILFFNRKKKNIYLTINSTLNFRTILSIITRLTNFNYEVITKYHSSICWNPFYPPIILAQVSDRLFNSTTSPRNFHANRLVRFDRKQVRFPLSERVTPIEDWTRQLRQLPCLATTNIHIAVGAQRHSAARG